MFHTYTSLSHTNTKLITSSCKKHTKQSIFQTCFRKLLKQFFDVFTFYSAQTKIRILEITRRTIKKDLRKKYMTTTCQWACTVHEATENTYCTVLVTKNIHSSRSIFVSLVPSTNIWIYLSFI